MEFTDLELRYIEALNSRDKFPPGDEGLIQWVIAWGEIEDRLPKDSPANRGRPGPAGGTFSL